MLIIALVLAVIGLASLVAAVVTSNELIAWVCIGASVIGVLLLIVDALRDRSRRNAAETDTEEPSEPGTQPESEVQDYPDEEIVEAPEHAEVPDSSAATEAGPAIESDAESENAEPENAEPKNAEPKN